MSSNLIVERLAEGEEARLVRVRLAALQDAPWAFGTTYAEASSWDDGEWTRQLAKFPTFIAVIDGADVGIVRGYRADAHESSGWLISMWVAACARGRGVGEGLIDAVVGWARAEGLARLFLDVRVENASARSLYLRKGFTETGKRSANPPPDEHVIECEMVCELR